MELKKVGLVLFLLGFTATTVDATGFNPNSLITQLLPQIEGDSDDNYVKSNTEPCCDNCLCTNSIPPKCQCTDWAEDCHSACKGCICQRIWPPRCRCFDETDTCYDKCTSTSQETAKAHDRYN
ncbi:hypothetical protein GLYMA_09G260301v4 [Glycine max]|uniref:Bowman-Birk type proteinase inhibitor n=1 Tax=Glycine max TaxID=3847 RepID=UPI0002338A6F|nr:Bowman-Birk type proteinase inhibitor-like [Glycine max]KAG4388906.1 hypothetical protein GLYMA_09G260301v4 [Glycine max]|eukprot:XP_003534567.1 Bowman-Birk type proteinase inhibitor-like [Glycine max]